MSGKTRKGFLQTRRRTICSTNRVKIATSDDGKKYRSIDGQCRAVDAYEGHVVIDKQLCDTVQHHAVMGKHNELHVDVLRQHLDVVLDRAELKHDTTQWVHSAVLCSNKTASTTSSVKIPFFSSFQVIPKKLYVIYFKLDSFMSSNRQCVDRGCRYLLSKADHAQPCTAEDHSLKVPKTSLYCVWQWHYWCYIQWLKKPDHWESKNANTSHGSVVTCLTFGGIVSDDSITTEPWGERKSNSFQWSIWKRIAASLFLLTLCQWFSVQPCRRSDKVKQTLTEQVCM